MSGSVQKKMGAGSQTKRLQTTHFELKALTEEGFFSGYASVFNAEDLQQDVILPGAFQQTLAKMTAVQKRPKLLWQHDAKEPIGRWEELREDAYGLYVKGRLFLDLAKGREAYTLIKEREVDGLSIGFVPKEYRPNSKGGNTIQSLDLYEISLVTFPAHPQANVRRVKTLEEGDMPALHTLNHQKEKNMKTDQSLSLTQSDVSQERSPLPQRPQVAMSTKQDPIGFEAFLRRGEPFQQKGLRVIDLNMGGHLIPQVLHDRLLDHVETLSPIRKLARTLQISTSSVDILLSQSIPEVGWAGETDARNETDPGEVKKLRIHVHELYANPKATQKLLDDANVDVENWLLQRVAERMAQMETAAFIKGDGNQKPKGFLSYNFGNLHTPGADEIGALETGVDGAFPANNPADLLIDVLHSMPTKYLDGAVWLMSRTALAEVRKLKDPRTGQYLWQPGLGAQESNLLGHSVVVCDEMPALKSGTESASIVLANFKEAYQIVDRAGTHILRDPYSAKPYVEFYVTKRLGGDVVNFEAIKVLNFKA